MRFIEKFSGTSGSKSVSSSMLMHSILPETLSEGNISAAGSSKLKSTPTDKKKKKKKVWLGSDFAT